jgi:hypothetical protein
MNIPILTIPKKSCLWERNFLGILFWECYYFLGTVYQTLGDETNATTWYRRFLQRAPKTQQLAEMRAAATQSEEFAAKK